MLLLATLIILASTNMKAQKKIKPENFAGVWELTERKVPAGDKSTPAGPGQYKLFTIDHKLQMFQITNKGTVITSYGSYKLLTDSTIEESFTKSVYFTDPKPGITIFRFLDATTLSTKYGVPGAYEEEIWKRIPYAGDKR